MPLVALLEKTLADAVESGAVRSSYAGEDVAGSILSTIMFNAAYASTISGTESHDNARAADEMWEFISGGIMNGST